VSKWLANFLMRISPHDETRLHENTEKIKDDIKDRAHVRAEAEKRSRDYIEMQLGIMRRE
jgi:hypothetical protein